MRWRFFGASAVLGALFATAAGACGGDDAGDTHGPTFDGGGDAIATPSDARADRVLLDVAPDTAAPRDAGVDAPRMDAGADAPVDAGVDAPGVDAGVDAGSTDAGVDAPVDAGLDAPVDAGVDAPPPPVDAGEDAAPDAMVDSGQSDGGAADAGPCTGEMAVIGNLGISSAFTDIYSGGSWTVHILAGGVAAEPSIVPYAGGWLAVYGSFGGGNQGALMSTRYDQGSWSAPAQIGAAEVTGTPSLALLGNDAHVVYLGFDDKLYHGTYSGGAWDAASDPVGGAGASQDFSPAAPTLTSTGAELDTGFAGNDANVYARPWSGSWMSATQIKTTSSNTLSPRIVALAPGGTNDLLLVWSRANDFVLMYSARNAGTKMWSNPTMLVDATVFSPNPTSIAALPGGRAVLVYEGSDGKAYLSRWSGASWSAASPLFASNNPSVGSPPDVAPGICGDDAEVAYLMGGNIHVASVAGATTTDQALAGTGMSGFAVIATRP